MTGRDPFERHRVATPLELLFDLTFVVAFGLSASEFAHLLVTGHVVAGLTAFLFATFAICWAWINFTWFASAYDTDDWVYRLMTMVQMVGVLILALGLPRFFASIEHGEHVDNAVLAAGYVVMRIALVGQWLRAARQDPEHRSACLTYATVVTIVQIGWIGTDVPARVGAVLTDGLGAAGLLRDAGPVAGRAAAAARRGMPTTSPSGTACWRSSRSVRVSSAPSHRSAPWWGNTAGRTDASCSSWQAPGLTFGMWWVYFVVPAADLLHVRREASFVFGYVHMAVFGAIVATGAGLHTAAYYVEGHSELGEVGTVFAVAIPVGVFIGLVYVVYALLVRTTGRRSICCCWR